MALSGSAFLYQIRLCKLKQGCLCERHWADALIIWCFHFYTALQSVSYWMAGSLQRFSLALPCLIITCGLLVKTCLILKINLMLAAFWSWAHLSFHFNVLSHQNLWNQTSACLNPRSVPFLGYYFSLTHKYPQKQAINCVNIKENTCEHVLQVSFFFAYLFLHC